MVFCLTYEGAKRSYGGGGRNKPLGVSKLELS